MAKRFTSTEIWGEDWFLDMPNEYKLFWYYILSECDHAGLFKVNVRSFCGLLGVKLTSNDALSYYNTGKQRIKVISESVWMIEEFFIFQYGHTFNINNPLHKGVKKQLDKYDIPIEKIRGLKEVNLTCKEKDKDNISLIENKKNGKEIRSSGNFKAQGEENILRRLAEGKSKTDSDRIESDRSAVG